MEFKTVTDVKKYYGIHNLGATPKVPLLIKAFAKRGLTMVIKDKDGTYLNSVAELRKAKDFTIYVTEKESV